MTDLVPTKKPMTNTRELIAQAIRDRLGDLGTETRDDEGNPDGGIWLDGLDGVAADLAGVALDALADAERDADGQAWWWRGNDGQWQPGPPPHVADWLRQSAANPRSTRPDDLDRLRARAQGLSQP